MELIAGAAFSEAMGSSSRPTVLLFEKFRGKWHLINQNAFEDNSTDAFTQEAVSDVREEIVTFLKTELSKTQPRNDYREVMELAILFLGSTPPRGVRFRAPGAIHQARWIAKVIYTFKVSNG